MLRFPNFCFVEKMSGFGQDDGFYSGGYTYDNQNQNRDLSYGQETQGYGQEQ